MEDFDFNDLTLAEAAEFNDWLDSFSDQDMADRVDEMFSSGELS